MSIGSRMRERRQELGMSRAELAEKLGVTNTAVSNYETDYSTPKIDIMFRIFKALDCDANYLYQDDIDSDSSTLSTDEQRLLDAYRAMRGRSQGKLLDVARILLESDGVDELVATVSHKKDAAV